MNDNNELLNDKDLDKVSGGFDLVEEGIRKAAYLYLQDYLNGKITKEQYNRSLDFLLNTYAPKVRNDVEKRNKELAEKLINDLRQVVEK